MNDVFPTDECDDRDRFLRIELLKRLRLQFSAAGNWKKSLLESGLPENVTNTIRDVVQQTGLLRFEKSEIATELIHHFQDGHERGHSFDELIRDFGKADVSASLFRSSKLRSRPMSVKAFRGSMVVLGGSIVTYLLLQVFFHWAKPNPSVDYSAKLNEIVTSMPIEQQAWPLYRDVWAEYHISDGSMNRFSFDPLWFQESHRDAPEVEWFSETKFLRLIRPEDEGWDDAVVFLDSIEELMDTFRKASKRPYLGTPLYSKRNDYSDADLAAIYPGVGPEQLAVISKESLIEKFGLEIEPVSAEADDLISNSFMSISLPHIQTFREIARVFHADTRLAMDQGDHDRAIGNVEAIFGMGRQVGNSPLLVCNLVGYAVSGRGMRVIEELVQEHLEDLSMEDLKALQDITAAIDFIATLDADLAFERMSTKDVIQRIYSDDGTGDRRLTAVGVELLRVLEQLRPMTADEIGKEQPWYKKAAVRKLTGPVNLFTAPSRKEMESLVDTTYDSLSDQLKAPMWEETDADVDDLVEGDSLGLLNIGVWAEQVRLARERKIARQDAVLLALAIHRYKRANGIWPTKLEELTDKWMDRTPIDRLSGKPLSFVITDDAPVIYSLGHDGNDDGGKTSNQTDVPWLDRDSVGDWVLWPTNEK